MIDVVIGGPDTDVCNRDAKDDVSECESGEVSQPESGAAGDGSGSGGSGGDQGSSGSGGGSGADSAPGGGVAALVRALTQRCLPASPLVGKRRVGPLRVGERAYLSLTRAVVMPLSGSRGRYVYCNVGGGRTYLLTTRGRVRLVVTTADPRRTRGVEPGDRLSALDRAYDDAERIGRGVYRASPGSPLVFGARRGRVSFVAVASGELLKRPASLARALRSLGPRRP